MARTKIPKECKAGEQRLAVACDAAGIQKLWMQRPLHGKHEHIVGIDRCQYPNPHGSDEQLKMSRDIEKPGKTTLSVDIFQRCGGDSNGVGVLIEIVHVGTDVGNPRVFRKIGDSYSLKSEDDAAWGEAEAISKKSLPRISKGSMEKITGLKFDSHFTGESVRYGGDGRVTGVLRYVTGPTIPMFKSKRDAVNFGEKIKQSIDAIEKKLL
jgi:hypothetical protein